MQVSDRYGDYGICGFYSLSRHDGTLSDFLFSCRVLHMGVEQWLYEKLGRPTLTPVGEVVSTLEASVDWITEVPGARTAPRPARATGARRRAHPRPSPTGS